MIRFSMTVLAVALLVATSACAPLVVAGAGAGVGAYTYVTGELVRSYPASYKEAVAASEAVARELKITIDAKEDDGIETTLKGRRAGDEPVTIKVTMQDPKITQVGVRVGRVGLWDRNISEVIHSHIDKKI